MKGNRAYQEALRVAERLRRQGFHEAEAARDYCIDGEIGSDNFYTYTVSVYVGEREPGYIQGPSTSSSVSAAPQRISLLRYLAPLVLLLAFAIVASGCSPTVRLEAPPEPVQINLNVNLDADVRVRLDRSARNDIEANQDIF